ncbi:hypothetical protein ACWDSJ_31185 [Nocardia sp. NPDC003482]
MHARFESTGTVRPGTPGGAAARFAAPATRGPSNLEPITGIRNKYVIYVSPVRSPAPAAAHPMPVGGGGCRRRGPGRGYFPAERWAAAKDFTPNRAKLVTRTGFLLVSRPERACGAADSAVSDGRIGGVSAVAEFVRKRRTRGIRPGRFDGARTARVANRHVPIRADRQDVDLYAKQLDM